MDKWRDIFDTLLVFLTGIVVMFSGVTLLYNYFTKIELWSDPWFEFLEAVIATIFFTIVIVKIIVGDMRWFWIFSLVTVYIFPILLFGVSCDTIIFIGEIVCGFWWLLVVFYSISFVIKNLITKKS